MSDLVSAIAEYSLQCVCLDDASDSLLSEWRSLDRSSPDSPMHDPEWLKGYFEGQTNNVFLYSLYRKGTLCGLVPFVLKDWPLKCQLGELTLASFPLKRLRLLGGGFNFPNESAAYDLFFAELTKFGAAFDAIYLEEVPIDSFLWKYLHDRELARKLFLLYQMEAPSPHPILRLEGSFEQYMGKYSSKTRNTLNRKVKKIREGSLGEMQFTRFERPEDVSTFLEQAVDISRKTYQWTLHHKGLRATEILKRRLLFAARHGWMRCYLLSCGGAPCAFMVGFQHHGRYLLHDLGYDPAHAKHSVGTVLQLLIVEDLFAHNCPEVLDLGDYGSYKEALSTESYLQGKTLLFRRGLYPHFAKAAHFSCRETTKAVSSILDRLEWKDKLKKRIRAFGEA